MKLFNFKFKRLLPWRRSVETRLESHRYRLMSLSEHHFSIVPMTFRMKQDIADLQKRIGVLEDKEKVN